MLAGATVGVQSDGAVYAADAALALPVVVSTAFVVGVVGWRAYPWRTSATGMGAGGLGAVATSLLALFPGSALVLVASVPSGGVDPVVAVLTAVFVVCFAFVFTFWVRLPVGCLGGLLYANAVDSAD